MQADILVINGPNLNMLGQREPQLYGKDNWRSIENNLNTIAAQNSITIDYYQSNHEGFLIDRIQQLYNEPVKIIILNAGALSHTSIALYDALVDLKIPVIEVHLSNIFRREKFRQHSYISSLAVGCICGFGHNSYRLALEAALEMLDK